MQNNIDEREREKERESERERERERERDREKKKFIKGWSEREKCINDKNVGQNSKKL